MSENQVDGVVTTLLKLDVTSTDHVIYPHEPMAQAIGRIRRDRPLYGEVDHKVHDKMTYAQNGKRFMQVLQSEVALKVTDMVIVGGVITGKVTPSGPHAAATQQHIDDGTLRVAMRAIVTYKDGHLIQLPGSLRVVEFCDIISFDLVNQ